MYNIQFQNVNTKTIPYVRLYNVFRAQIQAVGI